MYNFNNLILFMTTCFILGIIIIILTLVGMYISFNKTGNKFNFFTYLPFELNPFRRYLKKSYIYLISMILGSLFLLSSLVFYFLKFNDKFIFITFLITIFISILSFNILMFVKLSNTKIHLIFALINAFSVLLTSLLEFMLLGANDIIIYNLKTMNIVITIINLILCLILIFNPSYKKWVKMLQVDSKTVSRVKFNYIAILEWGSFIIMILNYIPLIISFF